MLNDATIDEFRVKVRGELIEPEDEGYESARKVYNATIDKRPRLIVRCSDVADVIAAVNFARDNGLLLAIRGGGHNGAGLGMCDDGLVIDLSRMRGVRVDPQSRIVLVEGGATWGGCRPCNPRVRPCCAQRDYFHHRGRWPYPGWGTRLSGSKIWTYHRQFGGSRCRVS